MRSTGYLWGGLIICGILIVVLILRILSLESRVGSLNASDGAATATLQESLNRVEVELATAKELAPALGRT